MNASTRPATERDSLLSKPALEVGEHLYQGDFNRPRRHYIIYGVLLAAATVIGVTTYSQHNEHINPVRQQSLLNSITQSYLESTLNIPLLGSSHRHEYGKLNFITGKDISPDVYHCSTNLMIMRHCDKGVKVHKHGHTKIIDPKDHHGAKHCNAKGMARSKYIASLFVEPEKYEQLINENTSRLGRPSGGAGAASIPLPVPMVSSSLRGDKALGNRPAKSKPQFPAPSKLYALSAGRHGHSNLREIETITPLAERFDLDIDSQYGLKEEKDLAEDYFAMLSESVVKSFTLARSKDASGEQKASQDLCNNGLTLVNWKHSRIPYLARALGCGRDEGCPTHYFKRDFDTLWMVNFQYSIRMNKSGVPEVVDLLGSSEKHNTGLLGLTRKSHRGKWKISAQLLNEGFDPVKRWKLNY